MTDHDITLRQRILQHVPADGGSIGNKALLEQINRETEGGVSEADYQKARDALIVEGLLLSGRGRGGSVMRAQPTSDELAEENEDEPLLAMQALPPARPAAPRSAPKAGAPRAKPGDTAQVLSYRHTDRRKNNPHVGMVNAASDDEERQSYWAYDPHIDPALNFDSACAQIESLIDDALASGDEATMRQALEQLKRMSAPYLNWTGKAERTTFEVDTVSLHVHERIDPATILAALQKKLKNTSPSGESGARGAKPAGVRASGSTKAFQPDLFSAPFENLPLREAIDFYKHERDWANRLVAGDFLLVMNSLLQKESMAGGVQMIYIDPPYGIKYGSNFQPFTNKRDVKDRKDEDLTQEPEMIKAFRDTWELGIHSYLTYLRDRLLLARELLSESGSVFVQISDENVHLVRNILDEVFGPQHFVGLIAFDKTDLQASSLLPSVCDYLVLYAKNKPCAKYHQLTTPKNPGEKGATGYTLLFDERSMQWRSMTALEKSDPTIVPDEMEIFDGTPLLSDGASDEGSKPFSCFGKEWRLPPNNHWKTNEIGMRRLYKANRIIQIGHRIEYRMMLKDFGQTPRSNIWLGLGERGFTGKKLYVVQTAAEAIERCLLMCTDPGDLVLDPTCGSGTTAFVAEKWGRRWITCDTSRVAVTLAKQRLLTASYDYYELKYPHEGLKGGFIYKTVPHVTLKSIANNPEIDEIYQRMHPAVETALADLNAVLVGAGHARDGRGGDRGHGPLLREWEVPFDFPADWPTSSRAPFDAFHAARQAMQRQMDASIAAHADRETLYDQPQVSKTKLRITGPFTVEAVPFATVLQLDEAEQPRDADVAVTRSSETSRQGQWRDELLKTGIRGKGGQILKLADLEPLPGARYIHAVGTMVDSGERVAVSFGPEHAALEQRQVEIAMREAGELFPLPKMLVFCAFTFDPEAAKDIDNIKGITALKAQMNTDLLTEDLKKARASNESFWLMGQPEVEVSSCEFLVFSTGHQEWRLCRYDWFKELSGLGSLAEIHALGRDGLFLYALLSQGRNVWDYLANAQGCDFHTGEYCRGAGQKQSGRVPPVSWNSQRLVSGVGNLDSALREAGLSGLHEFKTVIGKLRGNSETPGRLAQIAASFGLSFAQLKTENLKLTTFHQVEVHGFDYFDTASGELKSGGKKQIALWALDTDYDNRSLFPKQVFFPMAGAKEGWNKLKKDIRAELDEDLLEQFHGTVSLPFEAGENRCIGVKIVDDRGIESLKVITLGD